MPNENLFHVFIQLARKAKNLRQQTRLEALFYAATGSGYLGRFAAEHQK